MELFSYCNGGYDGDIVSVEREVRKGIPSVEISGMAAAVASETAGRIVSAIKTSEYELHGGRNIINLNPTYLRKDGPEHDLAIALSAVGSEALPGKQKVMALGELEQSGNVRAVRGVLPAIIAGKKTGIDFFLVPEENYKEACISGFENIFPVDSLNSAVVRIFHISSQKELAPSVPVSSVPEAPEELYGDISDVKDQNAVLFLFAAAAGRHNILIAGSSQSGKRTAALRLASLLPELDRESSIETSRIHSLAGILNPEKGFVMRPPVRIPHCSASLEGIIGGGRGLRPGEVSLAHNGILLLDDAPEFHMNILQSLREPVERHRVELARAGRNYWYPADFQLVMTSNLCPCGNRGKPDSVCVCSNREIYNYWKRLGQPVLDRVDIKISMKNSSGSAVLNEKPSTSAELREKVRKARDEQKKRYEGTGIRYNSQIPAGRIEEYVRLDDEGKKVFYASVIGQSFNPREALSVLRVARSLADVSGQYDAAIDAGFVLTALGNEIDFISRVYNPNSIETSVSHKNIPYVSSGNEIEEFKTEAKHMAKEQLEQKLFNLSLAVGNEPSEFRKEKLEIYFSEFLERIEDKAKASDKKKSRGRGR